LGQLHFTKKQMEQTKLSQTHKLNQADGVKLDNTLVHFRGASKEVLRRLHFASHAPPESVSDQNMVYLPANATSLA
jgi:hypothetical protein